MYLDYCQFFWQKSYYSFYKFFNDARSGKWRSGKRRSALFCSKGIRIKCIVGFQGVVQLGGPDLWYNWGSPIRVGAHKYSNHAIYLLRICLLCPIHIIPSVMCMFFQVFSSFLYHFSFFTSKWREKGKTRFQPVNEVRHTHLMVRMYNINQYYWLCLCICCRTGVTFCSYLCSHMEAYDTN